MSKVYWSDFHSNMHSKHMDDIESWYDFATDMLDFWAPVYYPYFVNTSETGFHYEDTVPSKQYNLDWEKLRQFCKTKNDEFILYMGYEWQGDGSDGDHNVFYKSLDNNMKMPSTYEGLCEELTINEAIAIPHHTGYKSGHRGKNWNTHNEKISPIVEIYSSHGSSESSDATIPLNVHIHMGPRGEEGTVLHALKNGVKVGIMASGDNHVCPAISGNGFMGVISDDYSREGLFNAMINRHTYAVTRSKIILDYKLNGSILGSKVASKEKNVADINVIGSNAIDRIEVIRNGIVEKTFVHNGTWEEDELDGKVKFKFELELGWGPDRRVFPDIEEKIWNVELSTKGKVISLEKMWTSPGSKIKVQEDNKVRAEVTTRKSINGNAKLSQKNYLTPYIQNQSIIFEIEEDINNDLHLKIDELEYNVPIRKLLQQSILEAKEEEVQKLLKDRFGFEKYYREDPWWHNAYKFIMHKACPVKGYTANYTYEFDKLKSAEDNILVKVTQKNGDVAWSSPIWIKGEE
ncbi:hypothetical protein ACWTV9_19025 [Clostridioides difficile]